MTEKKITLYVVQGSSETLYQFRKRLDREVSYGWKVVKERVMESKLKKTSYNERRLVVRLQFLRQSQ